MNRSFQIAASVAGACLLLAAGDPGGSHAAPSPAAAKPAPKVEPDALAALSRMGAFLRTLKSFEVNARTVTDEVVDDNGQKLQFEGSVRYQVRRPDGFVVTSTDDRKIRTFYYDGKSLTLFSPRMGFYASFPAPPTIRQTLEAARAKYNIELPLEDLFRWGTPEDRHDALLGGFKVGYARIDGVDTDQYAFNEDGFDWQIWIERGPQALPRKVVITTLDDAEPQFSANLSWKVNPVFAAGAFTFRPPTGAKPITIAAVAKQK